LGKLRNAEGKYKDALDAFCKSMHALEPGAPQEMEVLSEFAIAYSRLGLHHSE